MRKLTVSLLVMVCMCTITAQNRKPAIPRDAALEAKIEKTLSKMTLDEKIGQMLELNLDVMGKMAVENAQVDRDKVRSVMQQYGRPDSDTEALLKMSDAEIIENVRVYREVVESLFLRTSHNFPP